MFSFVVFDAIVVTSGLIVVTTELVAAASVDAMVTVGIRRLGDGPRCV